MKYKGFIIERNFGHYEIFQGDDLVCTADTVTEAKECCDDIEADACDSLSGQWW